MKKEEETIDNETADLVLERYFIQVHEQ